jgi:glucose-1-phosphate cytidylyltransferase
MQVVILCGGLGTRVREETDFRPKPMLNIGNRPILWHIMKIYAYHGYTEFILSLGYKGEMIKRYFLDFELINNDITIELGKPDKTFVQQNQGENGWKITLVDTGEKALKGARLKRVERYITCEDFMMTYGDGLADININDLLNFHKKHGKLATVTGINPASRFGELKIKGDRVLAFNEKPKSDSRFINGGFFVFKKEFLDYLWNDDDCDLEIGPLENVVKDGQLMTYKHMGLWACMDTLRDMDYLNKLWAENKAFWKIWE